MIVITGATGNIGTALSEQLAKSGTKHRIVARNPEKAKKDPNIEVVKASYDDKAALEKAFAGATKIFLLSSTSAEAVQWHKNMIDAAKKVGAKHIVRLSTMGSDKASPVKLGQYHCECDDYLKASGLEWTILQPTYFMQNFLMSASTIKKDGAFYGAAKDGKLPAIDARDIGAAAAKTLTTDGHAGKTYMLTGNEPLSFAEVAAKIGKVTGKTVKYVDLTPEQFKAGLVSAGLPDGFAQDFVTLHGFIASGGMSQVQPATKEVDIGTVRGWDDFLGTYGGAFK